LIFQREGSVFVCINLDSIGLLNPNLTVTISITKKPKIIITIVMTNRFIFGFILYT